MTTEVVFDPKYNVVGVDPDNNSLVQIPGISFQAPSTTDTYAKFRLIPNFNPHTVFADGVQAKPTTGEYILGMCVDNRNKMDWLQADSSLKFRPVNVHISERYYNDSNHNTINKKFDKYIEYTDLTESTNKNREDQFNYGWIRFKWQEMLNDGVKFPDKRQVQWPREVMKLYMVFDIEVRREKIETTTITDSSHQWLSAGPYTSPTLVPVRADLKELWTLGGQV
jgi:hypothetical protein